MYFVFKKLKNTNWIWKQKLPRNLLPDLTHCFNGLVVYCASEQEKNPYASHE